MTLAEQAAARLVEVVPLVMRVLAADMRRSREPLAPAQFRILVELHVRRLTVGELAHRCAVSQPTISRSISTLEDHGWVRRMASAEDGRVVYAELTGAGRQVLESMKEQAEQSIAKVLQQMDQAALETVIDGFEGVRDAFLPLLHEVESSRLQEDSE